MLTSSGNDSNCKVASKFSHAEGKLSAIILIAIPFVIALALSVLNPVYMQNIVCRSDRKSSGRFCVAHDGHRNCCHEKNDRDQGVGKSMVGFEILIMFLTFAAVMLFSLGIFFFLRLSEGAVEAQQENKADWRRSFGLKNSQMCSIRLKTRL